MSGSFSYRSKVIIKGVIRTVIVSLLSWESTVGTLEATVFRKVRDLIPYLVLLILL